MMNNKKFIAALGMIGACLLIKGTTVDAQIVPYNKEVKVDLDGDGKKESVRMTAKGEYPCVAKVYVNDKKIYSFKNENAVTATLSIVDLDTKDKSKELYVNFNAESDGFESGICGRYAAGEWEQCFTFDEKDAASGRIGIAQKHPGNGKVYVRIEFYNPYAMQGYATQTYVINEDGELKNTAKKILNTTDDWRKKKYRTTKAVKVTEKIGDKKASFTMKKGTRYKIYKVKLKDAKKAEITHMYIKTSDGRKGWVKIPNTAFCQGYWEYDNGGEWSDYAYTWG